MRRRILRERDRNLVTERIRERRVAGHVGVEVQPMVLSDEPVIVVESDLEGMRPGYVRDREPFVYLMGGHFSDVGDGNGSSARGPSAIAVPGRKFRDRNVGRRRQIPARKDVSVVEPNGRAR